MAASGGCGWGQRGQNRAISTRFHLSLGAQASFFPETPFLTPFPYLHPPFTRIFSQRQENSLLKGSISKPPDSQHPVNTLPHARCLSRYPVSSAHLPSNSGSLP